MYYRRLGMKSLFQDSLINTLIHETLHHLTCIVLVLL